MEKEEIWKDIEGYNGEYQVSNLGNIRSYKKKTYKGICRSKSKYGHISVILFKDKKPNFTSVARTVLGTFVGYPADPWLCIVQYRDFDHENCRLDNLYWSVCKTTDEYNPEESHRKGVLKPRETKQKMTIAKLNQTQDTIHRALLSRLETIRNRNKNKDKNETR